MKCPICQSETKVTNSRTADLDKTVKRRRFCTVCARRFTTYERVELLGLTVLKQDGTQEPYYRHKIELGLRKALEKRIFTEHQFWQLVSSIESDIFNLERDTVSSEQIGKFVLAQLRPFDKVAYLRFASVYRNFKSPRAFEKEIEKLNSSSK